MCCFTANLPIFTGMGETGFWQSLLVLKQFITTFPGEKTIWVPNSVPDRLICIAFSGHLGIPNGSQEAMHQDQAKLRQLTVTRRWHSWGGQGTPAGGESTSRRQPDLGMEPFRRDLSLTRTRLVGHLWRFRRCQGPARPCAGLPQFTGLYLGVHKKVQSGLLSCDSARLLEQTETSGNPFSLLPPGNQNLAKWAICFLAAPASPCPPALTTTFACTEKKNPRKTNFPFKKNYFSRILRIILEKMGLIHFINWISKLYQSLAFMTYLKHFKQMLMWQLLLIRVTVRRKSRACVMKLSHWYLFLQLVKV